MIAFHRGSVPELIEHHQSGFIVRNVDEAVAAVDWLDALDRREVRAHFERRFTIERMAADYLAVYRRQLGISEPVSERHILGSELRRFAG